MDLDEQFAHSSLKAKLKQTLCFSCSSTSPPNNRHRPIESEENYSPPSKASWIWIKTREHDFPEIRDKCANVFSRIGKHCHHHNRRYSSTDFSYDPLSYALNFQDDDAVSFIDKEARLRNFSSRLPASSRGRSVR